MINLTQTGRIDKMYEENMKSILEHRHQDFIDFCKLNIDDKLNIIFKQLQDIKITKINSAVDYCDEREY